ncbi:MAG: DUF4177 domain-containing protein [Oscillospiraceae bacterium]|nr:DUF4177 domain-containing protein [Oscillospiraceae bacterium]
MKKVEFVHTASVLTGYGFGAGIENTFEEAENIIKQYIENGWKFCGYIPYTTRGTGGIETISLIFEKED